MISLEMTAANCSGEPPTTSAPCLNNLSEMSASLSMRFVASLSFAITGFGRPVGPISPDQLLASYPAVPDSATVGSSGMNAERRFAVTPNATSFPDLMCGMTGESWGKEIWNSPPSMATSAGPEPLYGTCSILILLREAKSAPLRGLGVPTPPDP